MPVAENHDIDVPVDSASEEEIARVIVERAMPRVRNILRRYSASESALTAEDAEDIGAAVRLQLLRRLRAEAGMPSIRDFDGYVATVTYNAVYDMLRRRFPERTRLKNRLRYLVTHDERFALWTAAAGVACGLRELSGSDDVAIAAELDVPGASRAMLDQNSPAAAVADVFRTIGRPMTLDALVTVMSRLWGIVDTPTADAADTADERSPYAQFEWRQYLSAVWEGVGGLPPAHRAALLLNLRDGAGNNALALLVTLGIASFDEVAGAVEMTPEGLADLWEDLPFDDARIAALLGVSRQQVIHYRYSARRRLTASFADRNL